MNDFKIYTLLFCIIGLSFFYACDKPTEPAEIGKQVEIFDCYKARYNGEVFILGTDPGKYLMSGPQNDIKSQSGKVTASFQVDYGYGYGCIRAAKITKWKNN